MYRVLQTSSDPSTDIQLTCLNIVVMAGVKFSDLHINHFEGEKQPAIFFTCMQEYTVLNYTIFKVYTK